MSSPRSASSRRTGHPRSRRPRHTVRVVERRSEEPPLTARIRRRHTMAALSAVQAHRGTDGSNPLSSSEESCELLYRIRTLHLRKAQPVVLMPRRERQHVDLAVIKIDLKDRKSVV